LGFRRTLADFDKRITFEKPVKTPNGQGGFITTWSTICTVWARILPISAKEKRRADQTVMTETHTISIRYRRDIKATCRCKYKNRYFSIIALINPEEANEWLDINAKEVVV
jgi:SPP1 family predicted phage head-tail adaptor